MNKKFEFQLNGLRAGVLMYAPIFMYSFLRMREKFQTNDDKSDNTIKNVVCRFYTQWPKSDQDKFERLFTPEKKWFRLQREFIYFLIYFFSNYASKYINKDQDKTKTILDYLFEIFNDHNQPWFDIPLDEDAYSKYQQSDNPLITLQSKIVKISGEEDSVFLFSFIFRITGILKHFIKPTVNELFNSK